MENNQPALAASLVQIEGSIFMACGVLDQLLDTATPAKDCCRTGFNLICLPRSLGIITQGAAGACNTCPSSLV